LAEGEQPNEDAVAIPPLPPPPVEVMPPAESVSSGLPAGLDPESVRPVVQRMLSTFLGTIQVDGEGEMTFAYESTRVFIEVRPWEDKASVVNVWAPVAYGVPANAALYEWIAKQSDRWAFGHVGIAEFGAEATVLFRRTFPSEFLTEEHLRHTVGIVATTADGLDEEVVATLGGTRARDAAATASAADDKDDDDEEGSPGYL
jgi:hypothetical protein